ncbi:hypothetical protein XANCAGTX0491_003941 [Xanthoria calcicola]
MVLGEKLFFDWFAGKGTRHFLEDKERMRAARAMGGMPRRPLELTGPGGGMQRASIAPASFPFHGGGMVRPRHQEVIYPPSYDPRRRPCPQHHHPGGGHMYEPRHHRHARHNPRRIERRPYPRGGGRPDYEPDDGMIHGGYHDYDDNLDATLAIARARGAIGAIIMRGILVVAAGGIEAMVCGTVVILGAMGDTRTVRTAGGRAGMVIIIIIIIIRRR